MDELHDAIQDAQYIGAVTNSQRGPTAAFYNPSSNELTQFVDRQERALGNDWLGLENLLDMPLGFYFFRRFCEAEQHGSQKLDFLVEVTKFRTLQTPEQRSMKAREIWDLFFGNATPGLAVHTPTRENGLTIWTPATRTESRLHQTSPISPATASTSPGSEYSPSAGGRGTNLHSPPVGRPSPTRMSLGCLDELNVASMTTNGIVFWRKNESSVTRADVRSIFNSVSTEASPLGVGGDVVQRISAVFKRKQADSDRGDSMNCVRDSSPTSPTTSTVSTSELNDLGMESSVSKLRSDKRLSSDSRISALTLFDELEACVLCSLEQYHLKAFRASAFHKRLIAFLFLQKRRVSEDDFTVLRVLGRGGFGMVNGCIKRTSASLYAMKVMNKKMIKKKHAEKLCLAERKILAMISSPFVVCLKYSFQTPEELFLVLDLRTGGDLSFHLNRARFSETQVRFWAAQILLGIQHLHEKNIVYRDLKPENILLDEKGNCSISDLGLAVEVTPTLTGRCGTRGYWAPEMLLRDENGNRLVYNQTVDWWSYGCLVYELLYGKCPFRTSKAKALHEDKQQAYDKATLELTPAYDPKYFSPEAAELIQHLLIRDPTKRLGAKGAEEIKRMRFFSSIDWAQMEQMQVPPPFVPDNEINAASQADIGSFDISIVKGIKLSEQEQAAYSGWDYVCPETFQREAVEYLVWEVKHGPCTIGANNNSCCSIL
ncbi:AGC/GRK/BARK protein kinase [Phytophthora nicotianae]|uniref:AGC/GRK/BARK protein kinase n=2 Tax=Phytophthora nicotianae TaxID=4792 RepID=W2QU31_PHYN3|nr:AGC/GRK/BARK protein kinase [Phytophthora nicotianae INRA-310]ETK73149.1 AGC/GRK/BARK protein kinase [Phytophthora nicotianae]ETN16603.1 AGC/GRK/BARK protein kinase [Phytophthora nicotianae INRA-310]